jgi:hypothetical protein
MPLAKYFFQIHSIVFFLYIFRTCFFVLIVLTCAFCPHSKTQHNTTQHNTNMHLAEMQPTIPASDRPLTLTTGMSSKLRLLKKKVDVWNMF